MRLLVLGANGKTGTQLVDLALARAHEVTAFVQIWFGDSRKPRSAESARLRSFIRAAGVRAPRSPSDRAP